MRQRGTAYADIYDARIDTVLFLIDDALRDIDRRLITARGGAQLKRAFRQRPVGVNPQPLQPDDPRIEKWRRDKLRD